ncbi:MAG: LCP family protein [Eubacteriales bacterium]
MSEKKKKIILAIAVIVLIAALLLLFTQLDKILIKISDGDGKGALDKWNEMNTVIIDGEEYIRRKNLTTFLVIGVDDFGKVQSSGSYNNQGQADFLLLVVVDKKNETYSLIHINRDTMTLVDQLGVTGVKVGERVEQIALSHTYGNGLNKSCENTATAVSKLLYGAKIDYYISMNMDAISRLTDYIGGVEVTIKGDLTEFDKSFTDGATVNLTGESALNFIRIRASLQDSTNLSRMERQKQFLSALISKMKNIQMTDSYINGMYDTVEDYIVTNCDIFTFEKFADYISSYEYRGIVSPDGEAKLGEEFIEFYVDNADLKRIAADMLYDKKK